VWCTARAREAGARAYTCRAETATWPLGLPCRGPAGFSPPPRGPSPSSAREVGFVNPKNPARLHPAVGRGRSRSPRHGIAGLRPWGHGVAGICGRWLQSVRVVTCDMCVRDAACVRACVRACVEWAQYTRARCMRPVPVPVPGPPLTARVRAPLGPMWGQPPKP
jgi:hypothetical protein